MMEAFSVASTVMTERLDPGHYRPVLLENDALLRRFGARELAEMYLRSGIGHTAAVTPHYTSDGNGVAFVSGGCIVDGHLDLAGAARIRRSAHVGVMKGSRLESGWVLLVRKGELGNSAVVPSGTEGNCSSEVMFLEMGPDADAGFVSSYFNSRQGRMAFLRQQRGMMITSISLHDVPDLPVPKVKALTAHYIGDKVRQAERLRERMRILDDKASGALAELLGESEDSWVLGAGATGLLPSGGFRTRVEGAGIRGRLDPAGYHPELTAISNRAVKSKGFVTLSEVADLVTDTRARTSSRSALSAYISVLHVLQAGYVDMVAASGHQPESDGRLCTPGDVLLSGINPAANRIGVCPDQYGQIACSPEFSILEARSGVDPHYLAFALRSQVCLRQLLHLGQGTSSSRRRIDEAELPALWVPISPRQQHIGAWMATRQHCAAASYALTVVARLLVEGLIDRHISEADLIAAQKALEAGDRSADRDILSALRQSDAPHAKPLIPDVDGLYALLDEPQENDA
jgi:type I restriction enzyme S subunit